MRSGWFRLKEEMDLVINKILRWENEKMYIYELSIFLEFIFLLKSI